MPPLPYWQKTLTMKRNLLFTLLLMVTITTTAQNWDEIIKAVASDRATDDQFGIAVSISGDYAIVGAYSEDHDPSGGNNLPNAGSAYLFHYNGTNWYQQQKIVPSDRDYEDRFGVSVAISGDFAIVGTYGEDEDSLGGNSVYEAGSAYLFHRIDTVWTEQQKIVASDRGEYDYFGNSVSISGNYAIVGAYGECHDTTGTDSLYNAGSAYIFHFNGTRWTEQQKIVAPDRAEYDQFGYSVSISGDYALAGAWLDDHDAANLNPLSNAGSAHIFVRSGSTWKQQQKIVSADRSTRDIFGYSVSLSGNDAIIGAYQEGHDASGGAYKAEAGSAYLFHRDDTTWTQQQKIVASDRSADDQFGFSVSIAGDYAMVGAYLDAQDASGANPLHFAGSAYIFVRNGNTWSEQQKIVAPDRAAEDRFGNAVAISEDFALAGAVIEDDDVSGGNPRPEAGSVYLVKNRIRQSLVLSDTLINDNALTCFNAYNTITVAENGNPVIIAAGAEGLFIAGESISFLPGFHAQYDSHVHAHITTDSSFCTPPGSVVAAIPPAAKSNFAAVTNNRAPDRETTLKVYPNPTNGKFTLTVTNRQPAAEVLIYNTPGTLIYRAMLHREETTINLPGLKKGIYLIKVSNNNEQLIKKIMVN
jgi:hypothetical protein